MAGFNEEDIVRFKNCVDTVHQAKSTLQYTLDTVGVGYSADMNINNLADIVSLKMINDLPYITLEVTDTVTERTTPASVVSNSYAEVVAIEGETVKCEQLLNIPDVAETTKNGVAYKVENRETVLNGTATAETYINIFFDDISNLRGTFSFNAFCDTPINLILRLGTAFSYYYVYNSKSDIVITDSNYINNYLSIIIASGQTVNNLRIKPMLVQGATVPTTFQPYFTGLKNALVTSITSTNGETTNTLALNEEIEKWNAIYDVQHVLDNTSDYDSALVTYCQSATTNKVKVIGGASYTFTNNDVWVADGVRFKLPLQYTSVNSPNCKVIIDGNSLTDYGSCANMITYDNAIYSNCIYIFVYVSTITNANDMKSFMVGKTIHYQLLTPTYEGINLDTKYITSGGNTETIANDNAQYGAIATLTTDYIGKVE